MTTQNFLFLKDNFCDNCVIYAVPAYKIETIAISDTYDKYGQKISSYETGDSLELLTKKAVKVANDAYNDYHYCDSNEYNEYIEKWAVGDIIYAYDYACEGYDAVIESKDLQEDIDYCLYREACKGFNYFNGHNWQTITISSNSFEPSHILIENKELIKKLIEAIENKEVASLNNRGVDIYKYKDEEGSEYIIKVSHFQTSWASYEIQLL